MNLKEKTLIKQNLKALVKEYIEFRESKGFSSKVSNSDLEALLKEAKRIARRELVAEAKKNRFARIHEEEEAVAEDEVVEEEAPETEVDEDSIKDMLNRASIEINNIKSAMGMTVAADEEEAEEEPAEEEEATEEEGEDDLMEESVLASSRRRLAKREAAIKHAKDLDDKVDGFGFNKKAGYKNAAAGVTSEIRKNKPLARPSDKELAGGTSKNKIRWGKDAKTVKAKSGEFDSNEEIQKYIDSIKGKRQVESILNSFKK